MPAPAPFAAMSSFMEGRVPDIPRAIAALTYDEIEQHSHDPIRGTVTREGNAVPLLNRSIANDLRQIEAQLGGKGKTLLFAIAEAIDEALIALVEE